MEPVVHWWNVDWLVGGGVKGCFGSSVTARTRGTTRTHVIIHVLTTNMEEGLRKVGRRELERKIRSPESSTKAIADTGETTTGRSVSLEHDDGLAVVGRENTCGPVWINHGDGRVPRVAMLQEVGIDRLRVEDVAVDLTIVGRVMLDGKNLERVFEAFDETSINQVSLIPVTTRRRRKQNISVRKRRRSV